MKETILIFFFATISVAIYAQSEKVKNDPTIKKDTLEFIEYTDSYGNKRKALVVKEIHEIIIVSGDSLFTLPDNISLTTFLEKQKGFDIINDPIAIREFLQSRIKLMIIIKKKD